MINGTVQVGETLTADTSGIGDADGLNNVSYSYQWVANDGTADTDITGATDSTYILVAADEGKAIKVEVSFTDDAGNGETLTSAATSSVAARPNSAATGAPIITGTAEVGEILTASTSGIADDDGLENATFSYQWIANDGISDTDLTDATGYTYTLVAEDVGNTIKVRVSFTDDAGTDETLTSTETEAVSFAVQQLVANNPATGEPTFSGTTQEDRNLWADTSRIADADGLTKVSYSYQWIRNDGTSDTNITDATESWYFLVSYDVGQTIKVKVTFTDDAGNQESLTSEATGKVAPARPRGYMTVVVTGTNSTVTWNDSGDCSTDYNIYKRSSRDSGGEVPRIHLGFATSGSSEATVAISESSSGSYRTHSVTLELYCGTYDSDSSNNELVASTEVPIREGTYSWAPLTALTVSPGTLTPDFDRGGKKGARYTVEVPSDVEVITLYTTVLNGYQTDFIKDPGWGIVRICGGEHDDCIYGYGGGFILSDADPDKEGFQINLDRGENRLGIGVNLGSLNVESLGRVYKLTVTVQSAPATGTPTISGTAQVEETLTADTSGIADVDGLTNISYSYQWIRNDGTSDTDIAGATDATYTLVAADVGKTIKVRVTFTDDASNDESLTSEATGAVATNGAPTGTVEVGETLTADTSGIEDEDGLDNVSFSYQWIRTDGTADLDIDGATSATYTITATDVGHAIKVRVSYTDDAGNVESLTSAATVTVPIEVAFTFKIEGATVTCDSYHFHVVNIRYTECDDPSSTEQGTSGEIEVEVEIARSVNSQLYKFRFHIYQMEDSIGHSKTHEANDLCLGSGLAESASIEVTPNDGTGPFTYTDEGTIFELCPAGTYQLYVSWYRYSYTDQEYEYAGTFRRYFSINGNDEVDTSIEKVKWITALYPEPPISHGDVQIEATKESEALNRELATYSLSIGGLVPDSDPETTDYVVRLGLIGPDGREVPSCHVGNVGYSYLLKTVPEDGEWAMEAHIIGGCISNGWPELLRIELFDGSDLTDYSEPIVFDGSYIVSVTGELLYPEHGTYRFIAGKDIVFRPQPTIPEPTIPETRGPTISGTAQVGETLTVDTSGMVGTDGEYNVSFSYQWIAIDGTAKTNIVGATDSTYTLVADDAAKTIIVRVNRLSFTDDGVYALISESTATEAVSFAVQQQVANNPATGAPTISGTAQVGETLTADISGIADADGLDNVTFSYQWIRNDGNSDTDITSETDSTYTYVADDEGKTVKVRVSFTDDVDHEETLTSAATATVGAAPNNPATGAPSVTGTAQVGETLTADTAGIADDDGLTNVSYSYQWVANDGTADTDITDATGSTYTLAAADEGKTIKVQVSFTDDRGNDESLTSAATSSVAARPNSAATGAPTISGTAHVEETLTAGTSGIGDADGLTNVSYNYQWIANDGTSDTDITGATDSSYILVAADEGKTIKVRVSFTDDAANDEILTSTETEAVSFAVQQQIVNNPATGAPTISGAAQVGEALTADTSGIADTDGLVNATFRYQWMRNDGTSETDIQNATRSTYTLVDNDEGQTIKVKVSFTDDAGNDETLSSGATDAVAAPECDNIGDCDIEDVDDLLLPDLVSHLHEYSDVEVVVAPNGTELLALRFAGFVTNLGDGPLDLKGNPQLADKADLTSHDVWQRALTIDGDWVNLTKPPIDFEVDDGHDHFHVMGIVEYSLWDTSGTVEISSGAKIGFCLIDVMERPDLHANPGPQRYEQWDPDNYFCQSGRPRARILHMGVSEGWQDIYSFSTTFQWIDVSDVRPGYYRIGQRADPDNVIVESDETNNGLALTQRLQVVPGYVARPETVSVEPDAAVRFKLSVDEYFDDTNFEDGSPRTRAHRIVTQPSHGSLDVGDTVTVIVDGATHQVFTDEWVTYTPDPGYAGVDSFTFVALDESRPRYPINPVVAKVTVLSAGKLGITGFPRIGEVLTATTTGIADADGFENASFSYQWIRNDGGADADITGATDSNYVLVDADWGSTIKVRVSFTDDAGYAWTLTSEATAVSGPPGVPELPVGTAVFIGGVDLEWDDVIWADSYDVQLFRNGQWTDLPADDVAIAFYGAGAIISGLDPSLTLWFQVRARNAHGSSDWSDFSSLSSTNQFTLGKRARSANEAARGAPVINGTAQVGEILTADTTGIEDGNGLDRVQFRFQWATNDGSADTDISGATNSTYTLAGSDEGKTIKVRVAFTDRGGYAESLTSDATETVSFAGQQQIANRPATGAPIIGGTVRVGETLATDVLGIADEDGLENATFSYQWISNDGTTDADIQGETGATYTLTDANKGKTVKVRVSFTDDADNEETVTSAATATVAARPNRPATGAPIIGGTVRVGETLATDVLGIADEDGLENATFSYQWISNDGTTDADIQGETGATYTLTDANKGKTVKVRVSFTDDADNEETVTSAATATVAARPNRPATGVPIIGGTVRVGETLATDVLGIADEDGLENATFSYQWISNDGTTDSDIQGETGATYTLASAYVGKTIKVKVTFTDDADNEETLTSPATAEVAAGVPTDLPAKPRNLTGTANADGTVTLRWDAPDDDSVTGYQILRRRPTEGERTLLVHVNDTGSTATEYTDNDVTPDVLHTYRVTTINAVGLSRRSEFVNVTPTQPAEPAQNAPATGTPTISGNAQVGETLTADTSGISDADGLTNVTFSYQWIGNDGSTDTDIQHATGSSYTLVEADEGQTIKVKVSFADDADNRETLTSTATAAVAAPEPPAKPTGLSAAVISHDTVTITWDDPQDDAITGYIILRRDREIHPVGTFITITGDTGSADTTYTDDTVEPDKQYNYKVKAINEHGEVSERSDWVRANTPAVPVPDQPTGLSAAVSHDAVTLTWDDPQDDSITGYVILRRDRAIHPTGTFVTIAGDTGSAQTAYTDETVEPDKKYVYRIKAINDRGLSEMSLWLRTDTPN